MVHRGLSRDRCRVLPRRPDAMAAMGLSVRHSTGARGVLSAGRLRAARSCPRARHRPADRRSHLRLFRSPEDQPELHGVRFSVDRLSDHGPASVRYRIVGRIWFRGPIHTGRIRHRAADAPLPPRLAVGGRLHAPVHPGHVRARGPELEQRDMAVDGDHGGLRRPAVFTGTRIFPGARPQRGEIPAVWRRSCCLCCFPC